MLAYPEALPTSCVTSLISILRNKEVAQKKKEFFHCLWNVQGYLQKTVVGQPDDPSHAGEAFLSQYSLPEECPCKEDWLNLQDELANFDENEFYNPDSFQQYEAAEGSYKISSASEAVPWALIVNLIVPLILKLLDKYTEDK